MDIHIIKAIHASVNEQRSISKCRPLKLDDQLCSLAQEWAEYLIITNQLTHDDKNYRKGATIDARLNYKSVFWKKCGENLSSYPPDQVVFSWMSSPGHRENILNISFEKEGIGVARLGNKWVCCQVLIEPKPGLLFFGVALLSLIISIVTVDAIFPWDPKASGLYIDGYPVMHFVLIMLSSLVLILLIQMILEKEGIEL